MPAHCVRRPRARVSTVPWLLGALLAALICVAPSTAHADDGKPFGKGTPRFSLGVGAGFSESLTVVSIGASGGYFIVNGLEVGGQIDNTFLIWGPETKAEFPRINKEVPSNVFRVTPTLRWVFFRTRWFSPYVRAGVGPTILNNGAGVLGHWLAQPGAFIGVGKHVFIDVGVSFSMNFPTTDCREAFTYAPDPSGPSAEVSGFCGFQWAPRLGLSVAF